MLEKPEIDAIAKAVVEQVKESKHAFWIEPEQHYIDHLAIQDMAKTFNSTKSVFFKAFVGFVVLGSLVLAAIGILFGAVEIKG